MRSVKGPYNDVGGCVVETCPHMETIKIVQLTCIENGRHKISSPKIALPEGGRVCVVT